MKWGGKGRRRGGKRDKRVFGDGGRQTRVRESEMGWDGRGENEEKGKELERERWSIGRGGSISLHGGALGRIVTLGKLGGGGGADEHTLYQAIPIFA